MVEFIRIPPDSSGKRIETNKHIVDGIEVHIQKQHIAGHNSSYIQDIDSNGNAYVRFFDGQPIFDLYNNFKTSHENILGVYDYSNDGYFDLCTDVQQINGTIEYNQISSNIILKTTNENGSFSQRTTNRYHYYQPGTSIFVLMTVQHGDLGKAGNIRRYGYYDDYDGVFFCLNGTNSELVYRTSISGTPTDYVISSSELNGDPLNGTGKSGLILDLIKYNQYWISIGSSSGSSISWGIYHKGQRVTIHTINNHSYPLKTISLPVRIENFNISMTVSGSELRQISSVVKSVGNTNYTYWRYSDMECLSKPVISSNVPILSVRPKIFLPNGARNNINVYPETLSVYSSGGPVKISVIFANVLDLTGDTWNLEGVSTIFGDTTATMIDTTSPTYWVMISYYINKNECINIPIKEQFEINDEGILTNADGTNTEIIVFTATKLSEDNPVVSITLSYRELW